MEPIIALRIVAGRVDPTADVTFIETSLGEGLTSKSDSVSATAVRMKVGRKYGILTAVLDRLKVAIPTLAFRSTSRRRSVSQSA